MTADEWRRGLPFNSKARPKWAELNLRVGCVSKPFYFQTQKLQGAVQQHFGQHKWYWTAGLKLLLHFTLATQHVNSPICSSDWMFGCILTGSEKSNFMFMPFCLFWWIPFVYSGSNVWKNACDTKFGDIYGTLGTDRHVEYVWRWNICAPGSHIKVRSVLELSFAPGIFWNLLPMNEIFHATL